MTTIRADDERWMRRALALARRGEGCTRPNPPVGAVVVARNRLVGQGYHQSAGGPHAEVFALREAGRRSAGATLYVTLEPCSTQGRTPPCTDAIGTAGIRRVVVAVRDPNPRHAGRGLIVLREQGIEVHDGVLANQATELLRPFAKWIQHKTPYVTLKLAMTLDGRIADAQGRSQWITGPSMRETVHALRRRVDAILVGRETAAGDNPNLLPRPARGRQPFRVVVDSRGRLPPNLRMLRDDAASRTLVAVTRRCPPSARARLAAGGARVVILPERGGHVSIPALLTHLGVLGMLHVLCEGGGQLAGALAANGAVDEYWLMMAPRLLGGEARPAFAGCSWTLKNGPRLHVSSVVRRGKDLLIRAYPERG